MMSFVTPLDILDFWIGPAREDAAEAGMRVALWFQASDATDQDVTRRFLPTLAALEAGLAEEWAQRGPRARLAAIIGLDQFSRNIHRGRPEAFGNDRLARLLTLEGLAKGDHRGLMEVEQVFFYLPLEHSEDPRDQADSVALFEQLARTARAEFRTFAETTLDHARQHRDVITRFGRFPHRNAVLNRTSTAEEVAYLAQPGAGF